MAAAPRGVPKVKEKRGSHLGFLWVFYGFLVEICGPFLSFMVVFAGSLTGLLMVWRFLVKFALLSSGTCWFLSGCTFDCLVL